MINKSFDEQFKLVGQFVRKYGEEFSSEVKIFSDFIQVDFKRSRVLRSLPKVNSDEVIMFADGGTLILRYCFYYQDEKEDAQ